MGGGVAWSLPAGWVKAIGLSNSGISHAEIWYYPANPGGITGVVCTVASGTPNIKGFLEEFHTDVATPTVSLNASGSVLGGTVAQVTLSTGAAASGDLAVCCFQEHFTAASAITWTDPAGFTLGQADTASAGNHLYGGYDLSVPSGALSVTGKSSVASDQAHGWAGVAATFTATAPSAGTPGLVGAYLNPGAIGASTQSQANSLWQTITSRSLDVRRVYFTTEQIPSGITADLQADAAAGRKAAISMRPAFNPPTTADLDALNTFLASCKAAGLVADVSLWQEPYGSGLAGHVSAGLTISLFIAGWQFYAPTIRQYYPMVFDTSIYSVNHHNENAYYPGDAYVDKVATDFYCSEYDGGERLDLAASLADGATPAKPFGLWELNSSTDPTSGQTQAQSTAYFTYIQNYFAARLQAGKTNADLLLFNSNTLLTQETAITSSSDYRVGLYQNLYDALSGGGGAGSNQVSLASELDINVNITESLTVPFPVIIGNIAGLGVPGWPQLILEVGVIPATPVATLGSFILDDPVFGRLDSNRLADSTVWTDITGFARSISVSRPSTRVQGPLITYQAGTLSVTLDNSGGQFDPDNAASPFVTGGVTAIHAMAPVRLRAATGQAGYGMVYGFADGWEPAAQTYEGGYAEVNLTATDGFKVLAGQTLAALAATAGDSEDSGARVRRILTAAGWFTDKRHIATGNTSLQGTLYGDTALNLMQIAADSEIGELYVDGSGTVQFRNRQAILTDVRSNTAQAAFGDLDGTVHGTLTELAYAAVSRASDDTTLANDVQITRVGGIMQESVNAASVKKYLFPRTYARSDVLLLSDSEARSYAQWVRYVSQDTETRFEQLAIDPLADTANLFPQVLGREIGDRITVYNRPPGLASPVVRDCFIRGIQHDIDCVAGTWLTTWTLQDAARYAKFFILDDPVNGRLDSNALAF
jgi:hypothetical protein